VLDSDGSTSGSSVMEEVLVSDAQTFASMNLCESEDHMVEEFFCDESFITDCDSTTLVRPEMSDLLQESWQREVDIEVDEELAANTGSSTAHNNQYIQELMYSAGIKIHQPQKISNILSSPNMELKLFHLFLSKSNFEAVLKWTNKKLSSSHQSRSRHTHHITRDQFFAYVCFELAMSII
jgi:hypothetical protein